jgi:hypothetical protein
MSVLVDFIYSSKASEDGYYGNFSDHEVSEYICLFRLAKKCLVP